MSADESAEGALILVADDDEDFLNLVTLRLEQAGHQVARATDGARRCGWRASATPDLCVLDVMMPRMTGFEVLASCARAKAPSDVPVMMLTASLPDQEAFEGAPASRPTTGCASRSSADEFGSRIDALLERA